VKFRRRVGELRGLTQEPSVALSGLHRTYIWGIEQGRRNPSLINIVRIAEALGLKVGDLFDWPVDLLPLPWTPGEDEPRLDPGVGIREPTSTARRDLQAADWSARDNQAVDLPGTTCCHTLRAIGITVYLLSGETNDRIARRL
jgi:transcriptional regulator with XRE-family HTH domain